MANVFLTPAQVVDGMLESGRRIAETMPIESCEKFMTVTIRGYGGPKMASCAALIIGCRERLERQPGVPEGAD